MQITPISMINKYRNEQHKKQQCWRKNRYVRDHFL